jgi:hypothetical protein
MTTLFTKIAPTNSNCRHETLELRTNKSTAGNSTFAIGGVSFSADSFVVAESSVLRINICGKNPAHRKSAKRCQQLGGPVENDE